MSRNAPSRLLGIPPGAEGVRRRVDRSSVNLRAWLANGRHLGRSSRLISFGAWRCTRDGDRCAVGVSDRRHSLQEPSFPGCPFCSSSCLACRICGCGWTDWYIATCQALLTGRVERRPEHRLQRLSVRVCPSLPSVASGWCADLTAGCIHEHLLGAMPVLSAVGTNRDVPPVSWIVLSRFLAMGRCLECPR